MIEEGRVKELDLLSLRGLGGFGGLELVAVSKYLMAWYRDSKARLLS